MTEKILITGASGLLGSDMVHHAEQTGYQVLKCCHQERPGFISANFADPDSIDFINKLEWDWIIHCAAIKDPEQCEKNPGLAQKVNIDSTAKLARFAKQRNGKLLFISTDFVFDGTSAPYFEDSATNPLNVYGQTKADAEHQILDISDRHLVLRIPIIYGIRAGLDKSLLITSSLKAINSDKECWMDTRIVRYPTYTGDVARAALLLLQRNQNGIFHISGQDKTSKYGITKTIADILDKTINHIEARASKPDSEASRPEDAHLNMSKLQQLGYEIEKSFKDRLTEILHNT